MPVTANWRGASVDPETARFLDAVAKEVTAMTKAAGVPDFTVTPIPGFGSYRSNAASAGTDSGGGHCDLNAEGLTDQQARILESAARKKGGTAYFRPRTSPTGFVYGWQRHVHVLRTDCSDLSTAARSQLVDYRAGRNGLANRGPDTGNRSWVGVTWGAVKAAESAVVNVGSAVVVDAKVRGIQRALRQVVDGKLGRQTYAAVYWLSKASRDGRRGFLAMTYAQRVALQRSIGCTYVDGKWSLVGSEMPRRLRDAVGGVQVAMGLPVDRVWTDAVEGRAFGALMSAAGFRP